MLRSFKKVKVCCLSPFVASEPIDGRYAHRDITNDKEGRCKLHRVKRTIFQKETECIPATQPSHRKVFPTAHAPSPTSTQITQPAGSKVNTDDKLGYNTIHICR